jgi:hypothetical protein
MDFSDLEDQMARSPYGMIAGAIAVGFVLGGGLFTRLTGRIVGAGLRIGLMAALPLLKEEALSAADRSLTATRAKANERE